jgi:hypothetical protein
LAGLSATVMMVPSIAHTSSPRHRTGPAMVAAGPRSRSNNARNGGPTRRRALVNASSLGVGQVQTIQAGHQPMPHLPVAQLGEQAPGQQQIHHHPRR